MDHLVLPRHRNLFRVDWKIVKWDACVDFYYGGCRSVAYCSPGITIVDYFVTLSKYLLDSVHCNSRCSSYKY